MMSLLLWWTTDYYQTVCPCEWKKSYKTYVYYQQDACFIICLDDAASVTATSSTLLYTAYLIDTNDMPKRTVTQALCL